MDMKTIINDWRENAERHDDRNFSFLRSLKMKDDRVVDRKARRLHEEAFSIIDCTQCVNCCKTIHPLLTETDIERIAEHIGMEKSVFRETYLELDEDREQKMKALPCLFLGADNRCAIYEVRPDDCAEYPHTDKEGFTFRTHGHANNALVCPAVFYIVERMRTGGL